MLLADGEHDLADMMRVVDAGMRGGGLGEREGRVDDGFSFPW